MKKKTKSIKYSSKKQKELTKFQKRLIEKAVRKVVKEYGDVLIKLGNE